MKQWLDLLQAVTSRTLGAQGGGGASAELVVWSSMGAVSGLNELIHPFTRATGHKFVVTQQSRDELDDKLAADASADLIVQTIDVMDGIVRRGKVAAGTAVVFARAAVGLSVKSGAPWPDISTADAFRRVMLDARSVVFSHGGSGKVAARAIAKLGIADEMKARTIHSDGSPAASRVARGEVEMAIQQLNVSKPVAGTDYVGNLPGELHEYVVFAIAPMVASKRQEAASALIEFVTSAAAAPLLQKGMMEPASR
jgi:molybdate transport system substrate-binding protein